MEKKSADRTSNSGKPNTLALGLGAGLPLGIAVGAALGNIAAGIAIGLGVGAVIGFVWKKALSRPDYRRRE